MNKQMKTFKYPQTPREFVAIANAAKKNGLAMIQWPDGTLYSLRREPEKKSPLEKNPPAPELMG